MHPDVAAAAETVLAGDPLPRERADALTRLRGQDLVDLFYLAHRVRLRYVGEAVRYCSIVAAKVGACSEDCGFCSQSAHHKTDVKPGKLTVEQMHAACDEAEAEGASSFGIVNSGRGPTDRELDWMEPFFRKTAEGRRIRACATLGELEPHQAERLAGFGVQRINHNLETSRRFFPNVVSTHSYDDRLRTLRLAKEAGLSLCSGGIFGLGEDWSDRLDVAYALRDLDVDVVPVNFLHQIEGTPLCGATEPLEPMEALQILAIFRLILPRQEIKAAGGREKILRDLQSWIFFAGASSFLIGNYLTTFGRSASDDRQMLADLGLRFVTFDEVEHEATPAARGGAMSLPVLHAV